MRPSSSKITAGDIRNLMSQAKRAANVHKMVYKVSSHDASYTASLVDRGANEGIDGDAVRIVEQLHRSIDIQVINNHQLNNIPIVTAAGVSKSQRGDIIVILHQYAYMDKGTSIHSSPQIEYYKNHVDDRAIKVGGRQLIQTNDGYVIPFNIEKVHCHACLFANIQIKSGIVSLMLFLHRK